MVAKALAASLGLAFFEMDALFWKPNWEESSDEEFLPKLEAALGGEGWVLDGNYSRTTAIKWRRVEVVVWLDLPYPQVLYQLVKRTLMRSLRGEVLWAGNEESLVKTFLRKDSVIWWSLTNLSRVRRNYSAAMVAPEFAHVRFVRLRSRAQIGQFLEGLARGRC